MNKQKLIVEIDATEEAISKLLAELQDRADTGEFEITAVTLRKSDN
jgi:hypothetical protein